MLGMMLILSLHMVVVATALCVVALPRMQGNIYFALLLFELLLQKLLFRVSKVSSSLFS